MKCFVSRSFREEDEDVCKWFTGLVKAFGDQLLEAGGRPQPPREQVDTLIRESDIVCVIATARDGAVPQWVSYEICVALREGKTVFGFIEEGIKDLGMLPASITFRSFTRDNLCQCAAEHVGYIHESRRSAYEKLGISRRELLQKIDILKCHLEAEEALRNRRFDD